MSFSGSQYDVSYIHDLPHFCDKIHNRGNLRKRGSSPSSWGIMTAGWLVTSLPERGSRERDADTPLTFSLSFSLAPQSMGIPGGSSPVKPLETPTQKCVSMVILNPVTFTGKSSQLISKAHFPGPCPMEGQPPWIAFVFPNVEHI